MARRARVSAAALAVAIALSATATVVVADEGCPDAYPFVKNGADKHCFKTEAKSFACDQWCCDGKTCPHRGCGSRFHICE